ncbi:hemoglobin subunit mu isoform 2-T3 [Dugong dugon]
MLSAQERAHVAQVWHLIAGHEAHFGAELLLRLFTVYPSTKTYFPHLGTCQDQEHLLSHGQRILAAVGVAVQHLDNLCAALSPLADLHGQVLRVDPSNFPDEFTVEMQAARDKFLTGVAVVLTEKYR